MLRRAPRLSLFAATMLAALAALALPAGSSAGLPDDFWGVDSVHEPPSNEFALMKDTGVEVFRMPMSWRSVEPNAPIKVLGQVRHTYDWAATDRIVRRASEQGIQLHAGLIDTPAWVASDARTSPVRSKEGAEGWRDFVAAVVKRYGRGGDFWLENPTLPVNPPIAYQVWNEQNTDGRYLPKPNPKEYARLLTIAGEQIRASEPGAQILPGGMFGTPQTAQSMDAWDFMRILLSQPGARRYIDAVGVHPYSPDLRGVKYQLKTMRKALDKAGAADVPLQVTELGWSSGVHDAFFFFKGPKGQARMLRKSFGLMLDKRKKWNLERIIWFSWRDVSKEEQKGCIYCMKFGLLREDLSRKPSYTAFRRIVK
jgi:GH35 family endo-1,4-beta-xylanase